MDQASATEARAASAGRQAPRVPSARVVFDAAERAEVLALVERSLASGALTLGPNTEAFEEAFAARHTDPGSAPPHAVATSSGTSALEIVFRCLGVAGRDVVVPANTFFATAAAACHAGARPVFADVDAGTFALSVATLEAAVTDSTAAVVLVHIGGLITPEVDKIREFCDRRGVALVEDAAHAHGSSWGGRPAGSFSDAAAFSFYPTKLVTSAEGGMILTSALSMREEARIYRDQGKASFVGGDHVRLGSAWRMSEVHAAIGLVHLARLDDAIAARRRVAKVYDEALATVGGVATRPEPPGSLVNYYKYCVMLPAGIDRPGLKARMEQLHGVSSSGEVYAKPLHCEPVFEAFADRPLPVAEEVCARHVCLPVHSDMTQDEACYVAESFVSVLAELGGGA